MAASQGLNYKVRCDGLLELIRLVQRVPAQGHYIIQYEYSVHTHDKYDDFYTYSLARGWIICFGRPSSFSSARSSDEAACTYGRGRRVQRPSMGAQRRRQQWLAGHRQTERNAFRTAAAAMKMTTTIRVRQAREQKMTATID